MPEWPLDDVRVLDLSDGVAGAYAARLLAAFGADVVNVEPPDGDPTRHWPPRAEEPGGAADPNASILFAYLNAGKRSVVLDLDQSGDLERLNKLIGRSNLVIESAAPGAWRERGVDLAKHRARRPGLVVCSITPFGQTGPRADWRATALTAFASGGQMFLCGDPGREPLKTAGHQAAYQAGLHGFGAALTALFAARQDGVGDWIDISMQEVQASSLEGAGPNAMVNGFDASRSGNQMRATWGIYPCADGYVGVAAMARQAPSVFRCVGQEELAADPPNLLADPERNDLATAVISAWTADRTASEILEEAQRHRAPFTLIPTPRELLDWAPLRDLGFWQDIDHPVVGRMTVPGTPIEIDGERGSVSRAPLLGEHTTEVLAELETTSAATPSTAPGREREQAPGAPRLPLDGVVVLDLTQVWAGPFATRLLADMGADVIHVEGPGFPDAVRAVRAASEDPEAFNKSGYFNEYNRNKRSLVLDLQAPEARPAVEALIRRADIVIENWSVGVAERLRLGFDDLRAINPQVIFVQMPGFARTGPDAGRVGFGPSIEQMGGLVSLQGYEGGPPHKSGISYGDPTAGAVAAGACVLGLFARTRGDRGCHVVVPQRDNIIGLIGEYVAAESLGVPVPVRIGNRDPLHAPHNVYRARDTQERPTATGEPLIESWLAIAVDSDDAWRGLLSVVHDERLASPAYATAEGRRASIDEIDAVLSEWVAERDAAEAAELLQRAGVSACPVLSPLLLTEDEHLATRGFYLAYDHPVAGSHLTTAPVWRLSERAITSVRPAPCFGEHNGEVLRDLAGLTEQEIAELELLKVISTTPIA